MKILQKIQIQEDWQTWFNFLFCLGTIMPECFQTSSAQPILKIESYSAQSSFRIEKFSAQEPNDQQ